MKKFLRLVSRFEKTPIIKVGSLLFINENAPYMRSMAKRDWNNQILIHKCEQEIKNGTLKTVFDFDNFYSPYFDFTVELSFEKNKARAQQVNHKYLLQVAETWKSRIKDEFGSIGYTIEVYFKDEEWFLDCHHEEEERTI